MEDMSEYEGWVVKLTVTYTPATQTLHCDLCSVLEGEESPAVPYTQRARIRIQGLHRTSRIHIPAGTRNKQFGR